MAHSRVPMSGWRRKFAATLLFARSLAGPNSMGLMTLRPITLGPISLGPIVLGLIVLGAIVAGGTLAARSFAQEFVADGAEPMGVLLLRNGNVFRGRISRLGDRYTVLLAANNEVRFAEAEVAFHGATLDDAYRFKHSQLPPGQVGERLNLAEWCLRYGLLRQAAEEVTVALRLEPNHPRIPGLEARIEASMTAPQAATASANPAPANLSLANPALRQPYLANPARALPSSARSSVDRAAKASDPIAQRDRAGESPATLEQLESMARELPSGTLERFTAVIQPMLVNRCGANHCHGASGDSNYRLHRWSLGASATRRYTLRNLHATMRHVDREAPANSELLTQAARPHGGTNVAPLPPSEAAQLAVLRNWTQLAAQSRSSPLPATIAGRDARPLQSLPALGPSNATAATAATNATNATNPMIATNATNATIATNGSTAPSAIPPSSTAATPKNMTTAGAIDAALELPRDPFDPEIFNRRYGEQASP